MNTSKNFKGYAKCQQVGIDGSIGTETSMPTLAIRPRNPTNNIYSAGMNAAGWITNFVRGRNTPAFGLSSYLHSSYAGGAAGVALLNAFITTTDANMDSGRFNWLFNDGTTGQNYSNRVFGGAGCSAMVISGQNTGPTLIETAWLAASGNGSATFSAYTPIAGQNFDAAMVDFNGNADLVDGYQVSIMRGQAYAMFFNPGSYDPAGVDTGMLGGTLTLVQSPEYTISPGSTFKIRWYAAGTSKSTIQAGTATPILCLNLKINFDEEVYEEAAGMGRVSRRYTLADVSSGTIPAYFSLT